MGSALYSLGRLEEAAKAYEKGLHYDPTNVQMKESLQDIKDRMLGDNASPESSSLPNLFGSPDIFAKLQANPRTKAFLNDPDYIQIINNIQRNPKSLQ